MRRIAGLITALLAGLALTACQGKPADDAAFGQRVRAYLLSHPEVLQEVSQKLDAKLAANADAEQRQAQALLPSLRPGVEHDPDDFVANPGGAITVTEFYDYRCPHCANVAPKLLALIRANPDVRFVFKEMPIFGPTSEHAARAALAVKRAGGDSLGAYAAFMQTRPLEDSAIDRIALRMGAKREDLAPDRKGAADAHLARTNVLFTKLALGGTPAFIVGDEIIMGEDMEGLAQGLAKARARGKS